MISAINGGLELKGGTFFKPLRTPTRPASVVSLAPRKPPYRPLSESYGVLHITQMSWSSGSHVRRMKDGRWSSWSILTKSKFQGNQIKLTCWPNFCTKDIFGMGDLALLSSRKRGTSLRLCLQTQLRSAFNFFK
ncbi:unnamed protein product [Cuscuta epithymum]|uniref:Uncharacterized protein n=1 Tax=Cuscuta epithymum TaxID=186058 RepID=A0AAV0DR29_9ASTE|nr:unnamed protein product [Cuscuta epithymum]CAH9142009.1 unnamed protein product [Cuscuta epithymum]